MPGEWTEDPQGAWQYAASDQQPVDLVAFHPDEQVDLSAADAESVQVLPDSLLPDLVPCPTCGTGVHPDRIRG